MKSKLDNLSFKTTTFRHNRDLFYENDNIIGGADGVISKLRVLEKKKPLLIGEYSINTINVELAKILSINIENVLKNYSEYYYKELLNEIKYNNFNPYLYDKIVIISSVVASKEYRGYNVLDELTEMVYRDYYNSKTLIIFHALPFQFNDIDLTYYKENRILKDDNNVGVNALEYYSIDWLLTSDAELSHYKLYNRIKECGFERVGESNLFCMNPAWIISKIKEKYENKN